MNLFLPILGTYVHHLNPVIFQIWGPLAVRWYGLAYLLGFLGGYLLLLRMSKRGEFAVPPQELGNFIVHIAIYGVFLGGRLGYVLLYGWETFVRDPLFFFRVWEGGMASHGGMIGVFLVVLWTAWKKKCAFWNITDGLALVAPVGLFFGRIANFINGELWGRATNVPWAVIFPQAEDTTPTPRHPSQLYEAFGEGLLLFTVLQLLRRTAWGKREGVLSAVFLILYAAARITSEFFREPDSTIYFGWLTKGQLYSSFMILGAVVILWRKKLLCKASS
ncbi:MAG TPA: prolipoprotein diacylglyceryl transferase [Pontiellaceae bacterium]|nr:prolipoprotein diacylglyceryl transferase [Pontiellaceae bacterium]HPR82524.1 prolipoprotein diacylglyceryl transferase [Pontiellaceae bacterium]